MASTLKVEDRPEVEELRSTYLTSRRMQFLTPETKYRYVRIVNKFLRETGGEVDRDHLLKFFDTLGKFSTGYQRWAYQVLKSFYDIVGLDWPLIPRDLPPEVEPNRPYLEQDEAEKLLTLAQNNPLDHAMLRLVLVTGIRKVELRELDLQDYSPPRIAVDTKKHGERRVRTLDVDTVNAINAYIEGPRSHWGRRWKDSPRSPLFLSPRGGRLPDSTLTKWFRRYADRLGKPKGCGMHSLRRTVVTFEASGGMDSMRLQKLHGWKSPRMPEIYSRLKPEVLEKEAYEANPLVRK